MKPNEAAMENTWGRAKRRAQIDVRRYVPGESLSCVSVRSGDVPEDGGWIARNPNDHEDQWYIGMRYFNRNYELK